jgi:nitrite reductase/ring-hydroxylating ferredoxin subunit
MAKLVPVLPLSALNEMDPVCVEHRGVPYCVVRTGGNVKAFITICTHKGLAMFPPDVKKGRLVCPFHGVEFSGATGEVVKRHGKNAAPLMEAGLEIIDGVVHLETRKRHRKLVPKRERKWVEKQAKKLERNHEKAE